MKVTEMPEYIKRTDALKIIDEVHGQRSAYHRVHNIPAEDVSPVRHGQWNGEGDGYADGEIVLDVWYCSECGYCIDDGTDDPYVLPKYCPNCGAKMDGDA